MRISFIFSLTILFLVSTQQSISQGTNSTSGEDDRLYGPLITAQYWRIVQGAAVDIGIGAEGSIWIIGRNYDEGGYGIYKWIPKTKTWKAIPGSALNIAVDPSGNAWVVTKQSAIFRWTIDGWDQMPSTASSIGIGADGSVWILGSVKGDKKGYGIYRFNEISRDWQKLDRSALKISVDPNGNAWIVDGNNEIWRWDGSKWEQLPDQALDIGIGADGSAYIISTEQVYGGYEAQKWNEEDKSWLPMKIGGTRIVVDPSGNPYILNEYGQILQYKPAELEACSYNTWELIPGSASSVGVGLDNSVWAVGSAQNNQENEIFRWVPSSMSWQKFPGSAVWLSVDPSGNAWTIDTHNEIYRWKGLRWEKMPGTATRISIGADGSVWSLGTIQESGGYEVLRWLPFKEKWDKVPGGMIRIAVDPRGNAWTIDDQHNIYRWIGEDWEQIEGAAYDIGIGGNGSLYIISAVEDIGGYEIWKWDEKNQEWVTLPGAAGIQVVADRNGNPYIVNEFNQILRPKC